MENTLIQIFKNDYNRDSFSDNVLQPIFHNSVKDFKLYDKDGEQEVTLSETEKKTAKKVIKYGELTTHDNRKIDLYEVTVTDYKKVKIARVGLGALVKKLIIGNNAVFATFKYESVKDKRWRFSFIAYDSFFEDGQVHTKETNPKRYTYVFGEKDETYRTAIDRFKTLENQFEIKVKDIQDAFAVEAMSNEFFNEYRETHYANFVKYLTGEVWIKKTVQQVQEPSNYLKSVFNGDKKEARDFCKKLLGQVVFLYFIQKKGWLGATTLNYKEGNGDKNFIQNFYKQAGENDTFYTIWLSKLFYETLNKKRENDDFTMPNGDIVKIPYLNGGLFDKESDKYDFLTFPKELFTNLFEFFNRFNFTIYENSPEEHTIAVDPEMLGHIFENLLEDNKDKGAFYTPKEIVQYMTQESLIEYLATHLSNNKQNAISTFVKQKNKEQLTNEDLQQIDNLLDTVKICDPAIGSGAFPMGLLHEIFVLKERIAYDLGFKVWSPATVKENIIQNSIYGVDIEKGAVDIARLRFWLSLIVDEDEPKPLPNLAYKIVVGNSLVSKFGKEIIEIDWEIDKNNGFQTNIFGTNDLMLEKSVLLEKISSKQKKFFTANNKEKEKLKKDIRNLKLSILSNQLELMIETKGYHKIKNKKLTKKENLKWLETEGWKKTLKQINTLKTNNKPFRHFDWKLDFPEILNPNVNENCGFDIVIGNPPWVSMKGKHGVEENKRNDLETLQKKFKGNTYMPNLFEFFIKASYDLLGSNSVFCFIVPDRLGFNVAFSDLRKELLDKFTIKEICYKWKFVGIIADTMTLLYNKKVKNNYSIKIKTRPENEFIEFDKNELKSNKNFILKGYDNLNIKNIIKHIQKVSFELSPKYCKSTSGFGGKSKLITTDRKNQEQIEIIKGKNIGRYKTNDNLYFTFKDENITGRTRDINKLGKKEKILLRKTGNKIIATLNNEGTYPEQSLYFLYDFQNITSNYLLGVLNSKLITWFYLNQLVTNEDSTPQLKNYDLDSMPIVAPKNEIIFANLVDYLLFIHDNKNKDILTHTKNERIASHIEDVLDMMVYELYFESHMKEKGLDVLQFINPTSIENIKDKDKIATIIKDFYLWYQKPENAVRQRILLLETRSKDTLAIIHNS